MNNDYKHNHYVPEWYQKRFIPQGYPQSMLKVLDLSPPTFEVNGKKRHHKALRPRAIKKAFAQDDLYTRTFGSIQSRDIEKIFFGDIDRNGPAAFDYFEGYDHTEIDNEAFKNMMLYLSTQKLRTPKGLDWLAQQTNLQDRNRLLQTMIQLRHFFGAIWAESIWQIADAHNSPTKFIVSDHPITVYNRECGPRNKKWCRYPNDPPIHLQGTHTFVPLSFDKLLIITNKSWVWNPYQPAVNSRPNPRYMRNAMFNYTEIQINRMLSEIEVKQINFIIKSRATRYIAAANEEWLYPESDVSKSDWNQFGDGLLFMPDPRSVHYGGEIYVGFKDGTSIGHDAFGRRPWEAGFSEDSVPRSRGKYDPLERFQSEFATRYGPKKRGQSMEFGELDNADYSTSFHDSLTSKDNPNNRKI